MPYETLRQIRDDLDAIRAKLDVERIRRRRWRIAMAGIAVLAVAGVLENRSRVNDFDRALHAVQASRIETCHAIQDAQVALAQRDADLAVIAVEFAQESPRVAQQIIDRLNALPSADALEPVDCEEVIQGE